MRSWRPVAVVDSTPEKMKPHGRVLDHSSKLPLGPLPQRFLPAHPAALPRPQPEERAIEQHAHAGRAEDLPAEGVVCEPKQPFGQHGSHRRRERLRMHTAPQVRCIVNAVSAHAGVSHACTCAVGLEREANALHSPNPLQCVRLTLGLGLALALALALTRAPRRLSP